MDASHTNPLGAYAAINTLRLDDLRPHIFRTRDGGKNWTRIVTGIPDGETVNSVKEDPKRKGLLFAGLSLKDGRTRTIRDLEAGIRSLLSSKGVPIVSFSTLEELRSVEGGAR